MSWQYRDQSLSLVVHEMKTPTNDRIAEYQRRIAVYEDEEAYKQLFFVLFQPLQQFSYSIVKSREAAEDIVSDVFIEIWTRRLELTRIEDLKAYLFISVRNSCFRKLEQQKKTVSLDEVEVEISSHYINPDEQTISNELNIRILKAIEQLPPRSKLIYKLAKEDKLRYKDIAQLLNISVKTIDAQLSSALKRIASAVNFSSKKKT